MKGDPSGGHLTLEVSFHLDQGRLPRDAGPETDCSRLSQILPDTKSHMETKRSWYVQEVAYKEFKEPATQSCTWGYLGHLESEGAGLDQ